MGGGNINGDGGGSESEERGIDLTLDIDRFSFKDNGDNFWSLPHIGVRLENLEVICTGEHWGVSFPITISLKKLTCCKINTHVMNHINDKQVLNMRIDNSTLTINSNT